MYFCFREKLIDENEHWLEELNQRRLEEYKMQNMNTK